MVQDTLAEIIRHGLAVRRIPDEVASIYAMRHRVEGDEIVLWHRREMVRRVRVPKHAGWWMCQRVTHTDSAVLWKPSRDHLAPTLDESVALFLAGRTDSAS